ncbi:glycine-rich selenoprotein-like [Anopheles ziemanni]|uniref:glycine-rich selenoprotein-like n=1 Tax=Anopheles coustani TaxID=139045 RepID=UPI00265A5BA9|nr:glycine-rich selenoprotein-like [Anopheles coustani]XP_058166397.1 glycine-rich selenoprotein-like [Anopheles ziemanni]
MSTGRPGGGGGGGGGGAGGGSGSGPMGRIVDKIKRTMTNEGGVSVPVIRSEWAE